MSEWTRAELTGRLPAAYLGLDRKPSDDVEGRPCACGAMVWANPASPAEGVRGHNATVEHLAWIERVLDWQGEETS
jgi:hypothetical protein